MYGCAKALFHPILCRRAALLFVAVWSCGCSGPGRADATDPYAGVDRAARENRAAAAAAGAPESEPRRDRQVALIGGDPVWASELMPALQEAAGGMILEEAALDRQIARELAQRGVTIDEQAVENERGVLQQTLARGISGSNDQTSDLISRLRATRGLGDTRFAALLRRNAGLRALVRDGVHVSATDLEIAYQIRYGTRYRTRLILVRSELDAASARSRLLGKDGSPPEAFSSVAAQVSTDPSSERGGAIGVVSPVDPSYPEALRRVVATLAPGSISDPIALEQGFAIITVDSVVPAERSVSPEAVSAELEREVRLVREQAEMAKLASRLLGSISVSPLDASLNWGWRAWREQSGR